MNSSVYLRPLSIEDAMVSYQWRNNSRIWKYTGSRPDKIITPEIESEWLAEVLTRKDEKRFAICLDDNNEYIGNIFFTDIKDNKAQLHIFIGNVKHWGHGKAIEAMKLIVNYGFDELHLEQIYGLVNIKNNDALRLALASGFEKCGEIQDTSHNVTLAKMIISCESKNNQGNSSRSEPFVDSI